MPLSTTPPTSSRSSRLHYLAVKKLGARSCTKATNTYQKTLRCIQE